MSCGRAMEQWVPTKYHGKMVPATCGQTSIHGTELLCEWCLPRDAVTYPRYTIWDDYESYESKTVYFNVELPVEVDMDRAREAVYNLLERRCHCEHDCCGHWNGWGHIIKKIGKRTFLCCGHYAPNY